FFSPRSGNDFSIELVRLDSNEGRIGTKLLGPPAKAFGREGWLETPLTLIVDADRKGLSLEVSGGRVHLRPGEWSDWTRVSFPANALISIHGMAKFRLEAVSPEIKLYCSPVNFDPKHLPFGFRLSFPGSFASELADRVGLYKTMGWAVDTWSIQS